MNQEKSLENKLRHLYALQQIDNNLDELHEMKGDLPGQVDELRKKLEELQLQKTALEQEMKNAFAQRDLSDSEILGLKEKLERYKTQQYEVRSNKEYDALTREMDHATETIARLEKELEVLEGKGTIARNDIETTQAQIGETEKNLAEKEAALKEVSKTTEEEELKFKHDREKLVVRISKADLTTYERIRQAKQGKAIVPVRRGACGGCFNRVPPQKLLELRQNSSLYTCERCGRIIVSDEIVESSSTLV